MRVNEIIFFALFCLLAPAYASSSEVKDMNTKQGLNPRQKAIISISAFTADGDIDRLKPALPAQERVWG